MLKLIVFHFFNFQVVTVNHKTLQLALLAKMPVPQSQEVGLGCMWDESGRFEQYVFFFNVLNYTHFYVIGVPAGFLLQPCSLCLGFEQKITGKGWKKKHHSQLEFERNLHVKKMTRAKNDE